MYIQRLKTLADFLKTVPAEKFGLAVWRFDLIGGWGGYVTDSQLKNDCGTTACAIGWACSIPEFQAKGFGYLNALAPGFKVGNATFVGWDAVCEFFGLSLDEAKYLFSIVKYRNDTSINAVINRLEVFINVHSKT